MRVANQFLIMFLIFIVLIPTVHAANPRDELKQLTAQLQGNPTDTTLREKIIKVAQSIKPAPTVPEEARRLFVQGNSAFKDAKSAQEFDRTIALYRDASIRAPWWADVYFNLAKAYEQRQSYGDSIAALKLYLQAAPKAPDAREVQDRIYVLEEKGDRLAKAAAEQAAAARQATEVAAQKKQWASALSSQLNAMFAGKVMRTQYVCTLDPNVFTGCTFAEYKGSNWYTFNAVYPRGVLFEVSPDGEKVHFRIGFDNGPQYGGSGYFPPYVGTPTGYDINTISWRDNYDQNKHKTIQFWSNTKGQPVYELSDAPAPPETPGFDPNVRYRYDRNIGE